MLASIACCQFPQFVWRDGEKKLWNPIHRMPLVNRPEERIRLRVIEYLIEAGWSPHRISTEEALDFPKRKGRLRTDIICYTRQFEPYLLVECKAGQIDISEQTAHQIARYNQQLSAPYLLMTNGLRDYWYTKEEGQPLKTLNKIPPAFSLLKKPRKKSFRYWKERGFAGHQAVPKLRTWLKNVLNAWWLQEDGRQVRFLSFNNSPTATNLNHYYNIQLVGEARIALSLVNTPFGDSRLIGVFNEKGQNKGMVEINLDLLFDDCAPNASFYTPQGAQNKDIRNHLGWEDQALKPQAFARQLKELFMRKL